MHSFAADCSLDTVMPAQGIERIVIGTTLVTERSPNFFLGEAEVLGMCPK